MHVPLLNWITDTYNNSELCHTHTFNTKLSYHRTLIYSLYSTRTSVSISINTWNQRKRVAMNNITKYLFAIFVYDQNVWWETTRRKRVSTITYRTLKTLGYTMVQAFKVPLSSDVAFLGTLSITIVTTVRRCSFRKHQHHHHHHHGHYACWFHSHLSRWANKLYFRHFFWHSQLYIE